MSLASAWSRSTANWAIAAAGIGSPGGRLRFTVCGLMNPPAFRIR
jgi:nicotinamide mononucleotide (NMN) deamidase PncC